MTAKTLGKHLVVGSLLALSLLVCVDSAWALDPSKVGAPLKAPSQTVTDYGIQSSGTKADDLVTLIQSLLSYAMGFLGIIAVLIIMMSGFQWMTAGGDTAQVTKAQDRMKQGIIGLLIILSSWGLGYFVVGTLLKNVLATS